MSRDSHDSRSETSWTSLLPMYGFSHLSLFADIQKAKAEGEISEFFRLNASMIASDDPQHFFAPSQNGPSNEHGTLTSYCP